MTGRDGSTGGTGRPAARQRVLAGTFGLGLRLAVAGGRESATRLTIIAATVTLGVVLLLTVLAGLNAFFAQGDRYSWLNSGRAPTTTQPASAPERSPLWWNLDYDLYAGQEIARVDVAPEGPDAPVPPGLSRLPAPGEYYASPALARLLRTVPADRLADRYPGRLAGTIGDAALPSPDSLVLVVGWNATDLARERGSVKLTHILGTAAEKCRDCAIGIRVAAIHLVVASVAAGLLFPLLILIGTATRLNAARREERFAAIRLVGATPGQVSVLATVEAAVAAVAGTLLGLLLFVLFRDVLARVPFTGDRFFAADMRLGTVETVAVLAGVPLAAGLAARVALRRVRISPLGVSRRATPRSPRAYRLVPLVAGLAELAWFIGRRPATTDGQTAAFLTGLLVTMAGLVVAGPWLTMVAARLLAGWARTPVGLIAARRLADNPRAGFRAVSGVMLALFVASVATGTITTITANRGTGAVELQWRGTLSQTFWDDPDRPGRAVAVKPVAARVESIPGVRDMTVIRANPAWRPATPGNPVRPGGEGLMSCVDLGRVPGFGRCPAGAAAVEVPLVFTDSLRGPAPTWPAAAVGADRLGALPVLQVVVRTDRSTAAIERARTVLELAFPRSSGPPRVANEFSNAFANTLAGWKQLANVMIVASLVIGATSLAVVVVGGLTERKRPFSLLRLTGVPLRSLRRVVLLESAVPLLLAALVATGTGFLAAHLFLRAQLHYTLRPPGPGFYAVTAAGLVASLAVIAGTLPLLRRITGPETARNG